MKIREGGAAPQSTFPDSIDATVFAGLPVDYVLCSVIHPRYREFADILALFGILPIGSAAQILEVPPYVVFALFEAKTGKRVWESHVGSSIQNLPNMNQSIDPRAAPVVGAAFLLTQQAEISLARAAGIMIPEDDGSREEVLIDEPKDRVVEDSSVADDSASESTMDVGEEAVIGEDAQPVDAVDEGESISPDAGPDPAKTKGIRDVDDP